MAGKWRGSPRKPNTKRLPGVFAFTAYARKHWGLEHIQARAAVLALENYIAQELSAGRSVRFKSLGTFSVVAFKNNLGDCQRVMFAPAGTLKSTIKKALKANPQNAKALETSPIPS